MFTLAFCFISTSTSCIHYVSPSSVSTSSFVFILFCVSSYFFVDDLFIILHHVRTTSSSYFIRLLSYRQLFCFVLIAVVIFVFVNNTVDGLKSFSSKLLFPCCNYCSVFDDAVPTSAHHNPRHGIFNQIYISNNNK
jgi:hypothetical protein